MTLTGVAALFVAVLPQSPNHLTDIQKHHLAALYAAAFQPS
jgi:hypothetical protein